MSTEIDKEKLRVISKNMLDNRIELLSGCHELAKIIYHHGYLENDTLKFFIATESETDHLPSPEDSDLWDQESFKVKMLDRQKIHRKTARRNYQTYPSTT